MDELADELPESSPRFILLSYPLTLVLPARPNHPTHHPTPNKYSTLTRGHHLGLRPSRSPLRPTVLPPRELQPERAHDVRRGRGADAERGGGESRDRGAGGGGYCWDRGEAAE